MKECFACKLTLRDSMFIADASKKDGLQSKCRRCHALYMRKWHAKDPKNRQHIKNWNAKNNKRINNYIFDFLNDNPCVDCGEHDPIVLEFDHRSNKIFNIGAAKHMGKSIKNVIAEIEKCNVRCANCHRRKTYKERGFTHRDQIDKIKK